MSSHRSGRTRLTVAQNLSTPNVPEDRNPVQDAGEVGLRNPVQHARVLHTSDRGHRNCCGRGRNEVAPVQGAPPSIMTASTDRAACFGIPDRQGRARRRGRRFGRVYISNSTSDRSQVSSLTCDYTRGAALPQQTLRPIEMCRCCCRQVMAVHCRGDAEGHVSSAPHPSQRHAFSRALRGRSDEARTYAPGMRSAVARGRSWGRRGPLRLSR
jgi:hypothetical protein